MLYWIAKLNWFIDSRSQQRRYGHIRSAPSFIDGTSSPEDEGLEPGDQEWDDHDETYLQDGNPDLESEGSRRRRSSGSPVLFASDPFRSSSHESNQQQQQEALRRSQDQSSNTERTPLLAREPSSTRKVSIVKGTPRSKGLVFAPDGIGVDYGSASPQVEGGDGLVAGSPGAIKRRRSSAARRRRPHDVGESTNGQTVRPPCGKITRPRPIQFSYPIICPVVGQCTYQSIHSILTTQLFNAVAVLVGIGLLSLPLAFAYAGWIGGTFLLFGFAYITCYTSVHHLSSTYPLVIFELSGP